MSPFVIDASSVLAAIFPDEERAERDTILGLLRTGVAVAPTLWPVEVANGLFQAVRRRRIDWDGARTALAALAVVKVELVDNSLRDMETAILPLARRHSLTGYDSLYLHVALSRELPLCSRDRALQRAAEREGIPAVSVTG